MPSNEEKFENLLESSKERLKSSVYIVAPDDKGWLLKRNSTECWISKKVFRGGGTSWKKKYFLIHFFDVVSRYYV